MVTYGDMRAFTLTSIQIHSPETINGLVQGKMHRKPLILPPSCRGRLQNVGNYGGLELNFAISDSQFPILGQSQNHI